MNEKDIEKLIKQLLSVISFDYNCECELKSKIINTNDNFPITRFYIVTYTNNLVYQCYFVSNKIYETFDNLNDMLQTLLNPNYELWIFVGIRKIFNL